ncbi:MAG: antibiotic biosynthesis monooxygenase [Halofilum sp. (in: g-proteobacteria)]|nr:antibiotic biosynthesis monooxygenase [Halofilum sp. (in: g-proteobacteria)]
MTFPAGLPEPPYYAVIFPSQRPEGEPDDGYAATAAQMAALAATQPGYLGQESVRDADGRGITVSYWQDEASIRAWRDQAEHAEARRRGREEWYLDWAIRVCRVERAYGRR